MDGVPWLPRPAGLGGTEEDATAVAGYSIRKSPEI